MKLLYCIHSTYNSGGMERILAEKANYLADVLNYDITIVTTEQQNRPHFYDFSKKIKFIDLGINYDSFSGNSINKIFTRIKKQKKHRTLLSRVLFLSHFDIVISMFERESSFLYKINDGSKKCLELHFSKFVRMQRNPKGLKNVIARILSYFDEMHAQRYDRFVVLTDEDKSYWKRCKNVLTIPNPAIQYNNVISSLRNKQVTAIGRLDYQKGFDSLIRIWDYVHRSCSDWSLYIYGSGDMQEELSKQISDFNLKNCVFLKPPTPNIGEVYANSSIIVSTSHYEGFPLVLLEGISCGIPIIAYSYKCGPKDLIDNGFNGYIIKNRDEETFAKAIISIIKNEKLRLEMGKNAYLKSTEFSFEKVMLKWHKLFNSLV